MADMRKRAGDLAAAEKYFRLAVLVLYLVPLEATMLAEDRLCSLLIMPGSVTQLIGRLRGGDRAALDQLVPLVYTELHKIASGYLCDEGRPHTLQPTALVHEAYLRLVDTDHPDYSRDEGDRRNYGARQNASV
jgi:hypothetical protein